jgi:hypothetical protein
LLAEQENNSLQTIAILLLDEITTNRWKPLVYRNNLLLLLNTRESTKFQQNITINQWVLGDLKNSIEIFGGR